MQGPKAVRPASLADLALPWSAGASRALPAPGRAARALASCAARCFGKRAPIWIVIVGASLLTLWRAHWSAGASGWPWGAHRHRLAAVDLRRRLLDAGPRRRRRHPRAVGLRRRLPAFYPLVFAGLCLLLRARVEGAPRTLWVDGLDRRARRRRHERRGRPAGGRCAPSAATPLGVATNLAYPVGDLILLGRGRRRLRPARLARRSHLGAARPGHRCSSGSPTPTTSSPSRNETYVYPSPLATAAGPRRWCCSAVAAWQPAAARVAASDGGCDALHRLPDRLRRPRPGRPRPRALGTLNPLAVALAAAVAARRPRSPGADLRENAAMLADEPPRGARPTR